MNNDFNLDADTNPKICPLSHVCAKTSFFKGGNVCDHLFTLLLTDPAFQASVINIPWVNAHGAGRGLSQVDTPIREFRCFGINRMKIHRNITFKRLLLDLYQDFRCQKPVVRLLGRPFQRSRRHIEMDLTYRCNLKCQNCNRSCTQAPSNLEISLHEIDSFIRQSLDMNIKWERIRLLGGEPTLHSCFSDILDRLLEYRSEHNPTLRLVVCTNGCGKRVNRILSRIPETVVIKNTFKNSQQRLFRPFNMAPLDRARFALMDQTAGCRILKDCGIGLTPLGYYPCAIAGGIDRIFGHHFSRRNLPNPKDEMLDQLSLFCRYCGHFGFAWPTRKIRISPAWERAYRKVMT